jgi:hypothetical protein
MTRRRSMMRVLPLPNLVTWFGFGAVAGAGGPVVVAAAAMAAFVIMAGLVALTLNRSGQDGDLRTLPVIDGVGLVTFGSIAAAVTLGPVALGRSVTDYAGALSGLVLALVMLGSVRLLPVTEQYARGRLPRAYWRSPVFTKLNRRLSLAFGLAALATVGSHGLAGWLLASGRLGDGQNLVLNWIAPALVLAVAFRDAARLTGVRRPRPSPLS